MDQTQDKFWLVDETSGVPGHYKEDKLLFAAVSEPFLIQFFLLKEHNEKSSRILSSAAKQSVRSLEITQDQGWEPSPSPLLLEYLILILFEDARPQKRLCDVG